MWHSNCLKAANEAANESASRKATNEEVKAEEAPAFLRRSAMLAWHKRWAFTENNGDCPPLGDVLAEAPCDQEVSRLPAH